MKLFRAGSQAPQQGPRWHGATPTMDITQIAVQEGVYGRMAGCLAQVSDAEYRKAPG